MHPDQIPVNRLFKQTLPEVSVEDLREQGQHIKAHCPLLFFVLLCRFRFHAQVIDRAFRRIRVLENHELEGRLVVHRLVARWRTRHGARRLLLCRCCWCCWWACSCAVVHGRHRRARMEGRWRGAKSCCSGRRP